MAVYVFAKIKGGEGASTHATAMAVMLQRMGKDTLLIDGDPDNESSHFFTVKRNEQTDGQAGYSCVRLDGMQIRHEVIRMKDKYEAIVVDVGAKDSSGLRAAFTVADKFVVPFCPSVFDMWTFHKISGVIEEMMPANPDVACLSFLNKIVPPRISKKDGKPIYSTDAREAAELLRQSQWMTYLDAPISYRKAFQHAPAKGQSVFEYGDQKAMLEAEQLYQAIVAF